MIKNQIKVVALVFNAFSKNVLIFKDCIHKTNHIGRQFKNSTLTAQEIPADDRSFNSLIFTKLQNDIKVAITDTDTFDTIIELLRQAKLIPLQKNTIKAVESLSNDCSLFSLYSFTSITNL